MAIIMTVGMGWLAIMAIISLVALFARGPSGALYAVGGALAIQHGVVVIIAKFAFVVFNRILSLSLKVAQVALLCTATYVMIRYASIYL